MQQEQCGVCGVTHTLAGVIFFFPPFCSQFVSRDMPWDS